MRDKVTRSWLNETINRVKPGWRLAADYKTPDQFTDETLLVRIRPKAGGREITIIISDGKLTSEQG